MTIAKTLEKKFNSRSNQKVKLTYKELKEMFDSSCYSYGDIAERAGVSRQAIDHIYRNYFLPTAQFTSGRDRRKSCTLSRRATLANSRPPDPPLCLLWDKLVEEGFSPSRIPKMGRNGNFLVNVLQCNGKLIVFRQINTAGVTSPRSHQRYGKLQVRKVDNYDFHVTYFDDDWWVFPKEVITPDKTIYIPLSEDRNKQHEHRWTEYKNNWDLIHW